MAQRAAIVTGASSGIGLEIARLLGEEGHAVTLAARRPEKLEAAAAQLAGEGLDVQHVAGNLGLEEDVQRVVAAHRERYGRLDVLVNNAGVGVGEPVGDLTTKKVDLQLATNLRSLPQEIFHQPIKRLIRAVTDIVVVARDQGDAQIGGVHAPASSGVIFAFPRCLRFMARAW